MEFFLLLIIFLSTATVPIGRMVYKALPEIKGDIRERKALQRIEKRKLEIESARDAHFKKLSAERASHSKEIANFDQQILEIERPAVRKMVERHVIEASTGNTPTDKAYWLQEKHLLLQDYEHISKLCEGQEVTELDINLLEGIVDRMEEVRRHLDRIEAKENAEKEAEMEALRAPAELFDFLETVNDPDVDIIRQMKATQKFVGATCRTEDIYYGRITSDQLLDMAQKKVDSYLALPNFQDRMQKEALRRYDNSDNPQRLLELWGVSENFNNWVKDMDKYSDNY